ncbi:TIGR00269 family protein [Methanocalculus sp.]|uniref:TIGR00269 family protein n=1 Tax=Methanocalculus sp. TaxID=2004547 RepID=UPI0026113216|nr:TIGR00269 family protein [Methanocalculus sp.]MDG6250141.1 TIGR00269 family protein [Methanocalculus sp.]
MINGESGDIPGKDKTCSFCTKPAVARLTDPDRHLCADHFIRDCEERVRNIMIAEGMISHSDRIAVGLSGGKDSTALLMILSRILASGGDDDSSEKGARENDAVRPTADLVAVTIDEGIAGYREETMEAAAALVGRFGISQQIISFRELFGSDLDTLLKGREEEACTVCGVLRRRALLEGARRAGATKIATGHNLDDEAQSVLMNLLRGDLPRMVMDTASGYPDCFIPRIKPLLPLSEKEIVIYLMVQGAFTDLPECPYAHTALRGEVREMLSSLELQYPGTRQKLISARDDVREIVGAGEPGVRGEGAVNRCRRCGEICSGEICAVCRVLELANEKN